MGELVDIARVSCSGFVGTKDFTDYIVTAQQLRKGLADTHEVESDIYTNPLNKEIKYLVKWRRRN